MGARCAEVLRRAEHHGDLVDVDPGSPHHSDAGVEIEVLPPEPERSDTRQHCTNSSATTAPRRSSDADSTKWSASADTSARQAHAPPSALHCDRRGWMRSARGPRPARAPGTTSPSRPQRSPTRARTSTGRTANARCAPASTIAPATGRSCWRSDRRAGCMCPSRGSHAMPSHDVEPPLRQLSHGGIAVECRRLDLRQILQLHRPTSNRFLTRFATDALGSGATGSNERRPPRTIGVEVHRALTVRRLAMHPHVAVAADTSLAVRLPSRGSNPSKTGSNAPQTGATGATLGVRRYNVSGRLRNERPAQSTYVCTSVNIHEHRWRNERDLNPRGVNPSAFKVGQCG